MKRRPWKAPRPTRKPITLYMNEEQHDLLVRVELAYIEQVGRRLNKSELWWTALKSIAKALGLDTEHKTQEED